MGMREIVIQYSIYVRTPKKYFPGVLKTIFLERSKYRTVSPFPYWADTEKYTR